MARSERPETHEAPTTQVEPLDLRRLLLITFLFATGILVVYGLLMLLFGPQLMLAGVWFKDHLGYWGVALYTFLVDMLIVPTTVDVLFPFMIDWQPVRFLTVMSLASVLGGFCGYLIARTLNHFKLVFRVTESYRIRGEALIMKYGAWGVVIAGLTPIPFSTVCWTAGLLRVPMLKVFLACLSRIPRMVIYYLLIKGGVGVINLFG